MRCPALWPQDLGLLKCLQEKFVSKPIWVLYGSLLPLQARLSSIPLDSDPPSLSQQAESAPIIPEAELSTLNLPSPLLPSSVRTLKYFLAHSESFHSQFQLIPADGSGGCFFYSVWVMLRAGAQGSFLWGLRGPYEVLDIELPTGLLLREERLGLGGLEVLPEGQLPGICTPEIKDYGQQKTPQIRLLAETASKPGLRKHILKTLESPSPQASLAANTQGGKAAAACSRARR